MFDLMQKFLSENIIKQLEERLTICEVCGKRQTVKINKDKFSSYKCDCGVHLFYPSTTEREYSLTTFISKTEYLTNKKIKEDKIKIDCFEDYELIFNKVMDDYSILPEARKSFIKFKKRGQFNEAIERGRFKRKQREFSK